MDEWVRGEFAHMCVNFMRVSYEKRECTCPDVANIIATAIHEYSYT